MSNLPPIPDGCFIDVRPDVVLIVRHEDGQPQFALSGDQLVPFADWKAALRRKDFGGAAEVGNPEGYSAHPEHDRDAEHHKLEYYGLDPSEYFICFQGDKPRIVRQSDGSVRLKIHGPNEVQMINPDA